MLLYDFQVSVSFLVNSIKMHSLYTKIDIEIHAPGSCRAGYAPKNFAHII